MITIKKSSILYKTVEFFKGWPLLDDVLYDLRDNIKVFDDVCTFVRAILMILFVIIPVYIILGSATICIIIGALYLFVSSMINLTGPGIVNIILLSVLALSYIVLVIKQHRYNLAVEQGSYEQPGPGIVSQISAIVSQKSSSFCTQIKVEDDKNS